MLKDDYLSCRDRLAGAGIEDPEFEAGCLIEHVTGLSTAARLSGYDRELTDGQKEQLNALTARRVERYPLQYLLKSWTFCGLEFEVGEGVLIPRDDTEVLFSLCRDFLRGRQSKRTIDLCAGSGAVAVALSKLCGAEATAVELSDKAFNFLEKNISNNHAEVKAVHGDIFKCHTDFADGEYDLIASNPPYISTKDMLTLQPEVLFEPETALHGGENGLDYYEPIIALWSGKLKHGGALAFEMGENQADEIRWLMEVNGFTNIRTAEDFGGVQRAIIGTML